MMRIERLSTSDDLVPSAAELARHCRVDASDSDAMLTLQDLGWSAMRMIEDAASLAIRTASIRLDVDQWPEDGILRLPIGPLVSADPAPSVTIGGESFTAFTVRTGTRPELRLTGTLTSEQAAGEVVCTYTAGWPDAASVPHDLRHAVADQAASGFDRRGAASRREQTLSPHTARVIAAWRGVSA